MAENRQKLVHLHTPDVKMPSQGTLDLGEIAVQHNDVEPALYIEKNNGEVAKFIDSKSIESKIEVEKLRAEGAEESLLGKIETLEGSNHTHDNKDVLDGITADKVVAWDAAKDDAIADAAEKYQVKGDYEAAGAAAQALVDAKDYVDGKVDGKFDENGAAAAVETKLNAHKDDIVAHITEAERTDWNAAKTAIDTFLKDADMTEKAVDTLAELQTYMENDGAAATDLVNRVSALESINHEAYIAADAQVLADAKADAAEKYQVKGDYEAAGAADAALEAAKADAAEKYQVKGDYEAAGAAAQAFEAAKADAAEKYQVKGDYEAAGAAAQALADAKAYTDESLSVIKIDCGTY